MRAQGWQWVEWVGQLLLLRLLTAAQDKGGNRWGMADNTEPEVSLQSVDICVLCVGVWTHFRDIEVKDGLIILEICIKIKKVLVSDSQQVLLLLCFGFFTDLS